MDEVKKPTKYKYDVIENPKRKKKNSEAEKCINWNEKFTMELKGRFE